MPRKSKSHHWPQLRSEPKQDRSQQRMQTILDAAAELFAEQGYGSTTTNQIAERAGTSIGSLYRFFPDKLAIFQALARQYSESINSILESLATPQLINRPVTELVPAFLDNFEAFVKRNPAFESVFVFADGPVETRETDHKTKMEAATRASKILLRRNPKISPAEAIAIARTTIQLTNAYLRMRLTVPEISAASARKQFTSVLVGYLSEIL